MKFKEKADKLLTGLWASCLVIGITAGLLAFATWTVKLALRMIGVI